MRAGNLDQLIQLFSPVVTKSGGEVKQTYTPILPKLWGQVLTPRGTESFEAARVNAREAIRVKIRYHHTIATTWQVEWNGKKYNITAVDQSQRRKGETWFTAEAKGV